MSEPFQYPAEPIVRKHGPKGYSHYQSFRPWLRDEFSFRCVYCLEREQWCRAQAIFDVDHFRPSMVDSSSETDYDNLLYACTGCNSAKQDQMVPNPLAVLTADVVRVGADGRLISFTKDATKLIELLDLNDESQMRYRRLWIEIVEMARVSRPTLFESLMGYPDDLPELERMRPPTR